MTRDALLYNLNKHRYTMLDPGSNEYRDRILAAFDAMRATIDEQAAQIERLTNLVFEREESEE